MTQITLIAPYKHQGAWVFDDEDKNLFKEALVAGTDQLLEQSLIEMGVSDPKSCLVYFSKSWFPDASFRLDRLRDGEYEGWWYRLEERDRECWLCPALLEYFETAPETLFIQVKPHERERHQ